MRCLSPHARYSINVFDAQEQIVTDARGYAHSRPIGLQVMANFENTGLLEHEIELALSSFSFSGLAEGVNPLTRIGVFDTEVFCLRYPESDREEIQMQIEQRLRELQEMHPSQFIIAETPTAAKPWDRYDEDGVEQILAVQQATGISPSVVRRYEEEHQNRKQIIITMSALEAEGGEEVKEEIVVES
jgi:hypothetical protein